MGAGAARIEPGAGKASFHLENFAITDYGSIPNGLFHFAPPTPSVVTFDVEWSGVSSRQKLRNSDPTQQFGGEFVTTGTHISWKAWQTGTLVFESSDSGQSTNFSRVGHEFNGGFFPG